MKATKLSLAATVVAIAALLLSACGSDDTGGKEGARTKLVLLSQQSPFTSPSYLAKEMGYYKEAGIDLEIRAFPTGTTALEAWTSGIGDVIYSGGQPALLHYASHGGKDYRMIQMATRSPEDLIIMASKSIATAEDLKGKTIATRIGSTSEWWLERYLTHHGLSAKDVKIINLDSQQMAPAIDKGDIDAFALYQPVGWQAEEVAGNKIHQLADATEVPGVSDLTVYGARPSLIEKNPEAVKKFVEATRRGAEYVTANLDKTGDYYEKEFGADKGQTVRTIKFFDFNPAFDKEATSILEDLVTWSVDHKSLDKPISLAAVIWPEAVKD
jgi:ABC-type nitrate/sulfonate/bicarbonate transport system substrate-binding protein